MAEPVKNSKTGKTVSSNVTYVVHADPKGMLPAVLVEMLAPAQALNVGRLRDFFDLVDEGGEDYDSKERRTANDSSRVEQQRLKGREKAAYAMHDFSKQDDEEDDEELKAAKNLNDLLGELDDDDSTENFLAILKEEGGAEDDDSDKEEPTAAAQASSSEVGMGDEPEPAAMLQKLLNDLDHRISQGAHRPLDEEKEACDGDMLEREGKAGTCVYSAPHQVDVPYE
eukprot:jgi/Bigna1/76342/fgenesh1_pg.40_\